MRAVMESAPPATEGAAALAQWYAGLSGAAIETYTEMRPDAPTWTFSGPGRADYWLRRQLHETVIHRWDLERTLSGAAGTTPLLDDVAVDTIDEFCTALRPLMSAALPPLPVTIASAGEREWRRRARGAGEVRSARRKPSLYCWDAWGRTRRLEISGDRDGLDAALEGGITI